MSPALIAAIISLVAEAVKDAPQVIADFRDIFSKDNPTPADWEALRQKVLSMSYADYVPASSLPAGGPEAKPPAVPTLPAQSNAPINDSGANAATAESQKTENVESTASAPIAAAPSPYLPDGSPNPEYNHLAPATPAPKASA